MTYSRAICVTSLLGCLALLAPGPANAQPAQDDVPLIMLKPPGAAFSAHRLRKLYDALKKPAGRSTSQILPLTKTEVWSVPKENVEAVRKEAARRGVVMNRLSASWNHIFQKASADVKVNDKQKSMMDR